jgi:hypothetical protein
LIDLTRGLTKPHYFRILTKEAKADLLVWKIFCDNFNGKCVIWPSYWESSQSIYLYTDASNIGFGGYLGSKRYAQHWTVKPLVKSINLLRNVLPGTTAAQAKFKSPMRDCNLSKVAFFFKRNSCNKSLIFINFSFRSCKNIRDPYKG